MGYELRMWAMAILKLIPGRMGCAVRRTLLPGRFARTAQIWDNVHIDYPSRLSIGERSSVNRGSTINAAGQVQIGNDVLVGPGVIIYSQNHGYQDAARSISEQGYILEKVVIEDGAWIAARAVVLPGVRIGAGAVVAAGAVVTANVAANTIVAGVPARVIGKREPAGN